MDQTLFTGGNILTVILTVISVVFIHKRITNSKRKPFPPGPTPLPVIGNLHHLGKKLHISLTHLAKSYGPLISLKLGSQFLVVASTPAAATEILKIHDRNLSGRFQLQVNYFDESDLDRLSLSWAPKCGERWKFLRGLCRNSLFSTKMVESQEAVRAETVAEMVEYLGQNEGKLLKISEIIYLTVLNTLTKIFFSKTFDNLWDETTSFGLKGPLMKLVEVGTSSNIADLYPILSGLDLHGLNKKLRLLKKGVLDVWKDLIDLKRKTYSHGDFEVTDFLDVLIANQFANDEINRLFLELLTAGTDTTTTTIEWAMTELLKNQEIMKKLQSELKLEIAQNPINESTLSKLPYLQACIKETLRLHAPAPFLLPHRSIEDCEVMNYTIPKNSMVLVNIWAIGRDPSVWNDALVFNPNRFLDLNLNFKGQDFELLPFGSGRRICAGMPMAVNQVGLILATLVHNFEWSLEDGEDPSKLDMNDKLTVTLQKEKPLMIIPKKKF